MNNFVFTNKNSLSSELCQDIIKLFEEETRKYPGATLRGIVKNVKDTTDYMITCKDEIWGEIYTCLRTEVYKNLEHYLILLNKEYENVNFNLASSYEFKFMSDQTLSYDCFQIQKYDQEGGKYIYHNDEHFLKERHRVLTYIFYINDVEEGGQTDICNGKFLIKPESGKLVFFPVSWCFPHAGRIPKSGSKYIITGWIYANVI